MIRSRLALTAFPILALLPYQAHSEEVCDCAIKKGSCVATLGITPTSQPNGIFGAKVKVMTDTVACARVDYYVEHTPTVTVLRRGGSVEETVTGSLKPMNASMFSVDSCRICDVKTITPPSGDESFAEGLFDDALTSSGDFDPAATADRIIQLESQRSSITPETIQGMINTVQQAQQLQQMQQMQQMQRHKRDQASDAVTGSGGSKQGSLYDYVSDEVPPLGSGR